MSQPRQIVPGATYLFTRRVVRRHFLLRPEAAITDLIIYALAVTSRMSGIEVHAICVMSSHLHLVITDMRGELPRFLHQFDRLVALGTKVLRAWEGPVWEPGGASVVRLLTPAPAPTSEDEGPAPTPTSEEPPTPSPKEPPVPVSPPPAPPLPSQRQLPDPPSPSFSGWSRGERFVTVVTFPQMITALGSRGTIGGS